MNPPGIIALIGSGETATSGGQVFETLAQQHLTPLNISVLETPAGFEVNAARVAGRVADFLQNRLQNYEPRVARVPARKKETAFSPDSPEVVYPLFDSQMIFLGPGSPTYTVRQLENSLAWQVIQARHRLGASLVLASAAVVAAGSLALPVYEIFKAGEDIHWRKGLGLFEAYGLDLVLIPHWNNREGGDEVDTSRCFMGQERFAGLVNLLPRKMTILGIDEHTTLLVDFHRAICHVSGLGEVHLLRDNRQEDFPAGSVFPIQSLGYYHPLPSPAEGIPTNIWQQALAAEQKAVLERTAPEAVPLQVQTLSEERQAARQSRDWERADVLRQKIANLGWTVQDTPTGPVLQRSGE